jgi:hypothetical protein
MKFCKERNNIVFKGKNSSTTQYTTKRYNKNFHNDASKLQIYSKCKEKDRRSKFFQNKSLNKKYNIKS